MSDCEIVTLQSSDGLDFQVERKVAELSVTVKSLIEDAGTEHPIPLPNVSGPILTAVVEYSKHHVENPTTPSATAPEEKRTDDISAWDMEFCKTKDQKTLFDIILAANYLDIKPLLDLCCKTVANMIKGKTPDQIRATFNIKEDFTPEEKAQIAKENEWCEER